LGGDSNRFVATLEDPENVIGVKWPGPTGIPTGTFQLTTEYVDVTDAAGNYAIATIPQVVNTATGTFGYYIVGRYATAGATSFTWGSSIAFNGSSSAGSIYDNFRVVSGCIKILNIGPTGTDQGLLIGGWDNFQSNNGTGAINTWGGLNIGTPGAMMSKSYTETIPLRNGMCVKWRPADYSDSEFISLTSNEVMSMPLIWAGITGSNPGNSIKIRVVFNYEGIAGSDTTNFIQTEGAPPPTSDLEGAAMWGRSLSDKIHPLYGVMGQGYKDAAQFVEIQRQSLTRNLERKAQVKDTNGVVDTVLKLSKMFI